MRSLRFLEQMKAFQTFTSALALLAAALLMPPVFERTLSMGPLLGREVAGLWVFAVTLIAWAAYVRFGKVLIAPATFVLFNLLFLMSIEFAARATVVLVRPEAQYRLGNLAEKTYDDLIPYEGHPFLQFTGVTGLLQPGATQSEFNNFGFAHTGEFVYEKPQGTLRIATLGGSTTANTYPSMMGDLVGEQLGVSRRVEVLNFGLPYWTTAHSLVNFVLNVVDFEPDYAVIHHAWNDSKYQAMVDGYRGDYSHRLRPFESSPFIIDRYLIRASALYRYFKFKLAPPDWAYLDNAVSRDAEPGSASQTTDEFRRYRRNIETIIEVAAARGIRPILTTMPHTLDPRKPAGQTLGRAQQIDQANAIMRSIAEVNSDRIIFVDLDELMTGKMEDVFVDLAHVTEAGRRVKAEAIGAAILKDLRSPPGLPQQGEQAEEQ
jgi:hypothetical protein